MGAGVCVGVGGGVGVRRSVGVGVGVGNCVTCWDGTGSGVAAGSTDVVWLGDAGFVGHAIPVGVVLTAGADGVALGVATGDRGAAVGVALAGPCDALLDVKDGCGVGVAVSLAMVGAPSAVTKLFEVAA